MFSGKKMKFLREKQGLNLTQFSNQLYLRTGLKRVRNTLEKWEAGETYPSGKDIPKLAYFFEVPVEYFFDIKSS